MVRCLRSEELRAKAAAPSSPCPELWEDSSLLFDTTATGEGQYLLLELSQAPLHSEGSPASRQGIWVPGCRPTNPTTGRPAVSAGRAVWPRSHQPALEEATDAVKLTFFNQETKFPFL